MRNYTGTKLKLHPTPEGRWRWELWIPPWIVEGGLKSSACNPSGEARSRRKAISEAEKAVSRQIAEDETRIEEMEWHPLGFREVR